MIRWPFSERKFLFENKSSFFLSNRKCIVFFLLMNYKSLRVHWLNISFYEVTLHQLTNNYFELFEMLWFYIKRIESCLSVQLLYIDIKWTFRWFHANLFHFKYRLIVMHRRRDNSTLSSAWPSIREICSFCTNTRQGRHCVALSRVEPY